MSSLHHASEKRQAQALAVARRDAAFQRFLLAAMGVKPAAPVKFDRRTVEGFCHA